MIRSTGQPPQTTCKTISESNSLESEQFDDREYYGYNPIIENHKVAYREHKARKDLEEHDISEISKIENYLAMNRINCVKFNYSLDDEI